MIDIFALGLSHALLALAALRLMLRADLDYDPESLDPNSRGSGPVPNDPERGSGSDNTRDQADG